MNRIRKVLAEIEKLIASNTLSIRYACALIYIREKIKRRDEDNGRQ